MFIVELFTYDHIIQELLMSVPLITFETSIASLLKKSMIQVFKYENNNIEKYIKSTLEEDSASYSLNKDPISSLKVYIGIDSSKKSVKNCWTSNLTSKAGQDEENSNEVNDTVKGLVLEDTEEEDEDELNIKEEVEFASEDDPKALDKLINSSPEEKVYVIKDDVLREDTKPIYKYWYSGSHSYDKVPLLIRLINSFIHKLYE